MLERRPDGMMASSPRDVLHQGAMLRQSRWKKIWKERYFVVRKSGILQCKEREGGVDVRDEQSFIGVRVQLEMLGREAQHHSNCQLGFPFRFDVTVDKVRRRYACSSQQDYIEWAEKIAAAAKPFASLFTQVDVTSPAVSPTNGYGAEQRLPISLLTDITVRIPSSRVESHNGGRSFVAFSVQVCRGDNSFAITRRYNEFHALFAMLKKHGECIGVKFPRKVTLNKKGDSRRAGLETFINGLLRQQSPVVQQAVIGFLSLLIGCFLRQGKQLLQA